MSHGQYDPATGAVTQDYAHYPRPEEYLVSPDTGGGAKLWQYTMNNGDQYAVPNKIKTQPLEKINGELESGVRLSLSLVCHNVICMRSDLLSSLP